jgi:hypothetical protein
MQAFPCPSVGPVVKIFLATEDTAVDPGNVANQCHGGVRKPAR